ncbi:uncharacterized protein FSUBG_12355 [Fusarium subglutinans]|uniref:Uncharacterized protein n=1 Tax=Gibberella subglutinans TaxID=42677 RepID=A0A8H5L813_GIBSU|nr:uncharacterized protein FSUBG_12355 [Fusarium subglutinans]KAF5585766.1 hypothetical protein FSUBG_12355 [Fusarium subglutinans]
MRKKTPQQKEMARKGFERRDAKRQQNQGNFSAHGQQQDRQSGAGHRNMGRDKNRDMTSIGPSLTSKHGIQKRSNESGMSSFDPMEHQNWVTGIDRVNTSYDGGPQNRIVTSTHTNKPTAKADRPADGNEIAATPLTILNTSQVIDTFDADLASIAKARQRRIRAEADAFLGQPRKGQTIGAQGDFQNRVTEVTQLAKVLCAECGSNTHTLKGCITTISGSIRGCIFCNSMSHSTDNCGEFNDLDLVSKVKLLVTDRASKPPIFTDTAWSVWLHRFLTATNTKGQPIPETFPWTVNFARHIYGGKAEKSVQEYQSDFDRAQSIGVLPRDWRMQSMKDVFTNFWEKEGRVWPARLDSLSSVTKASTGATTSGQGAESADSSTIEEIRRLGETVIRQAMQLGEKDREIEGLKKENQRLRKENEDLKKGLA